MVAEDRYSARDALELIDVEYDILDPVVDVRTALAPDAPVIRDRPRGQDRQPLLRLGDRRQGRHRGGLRQGRRRGDRGHRLPARPPGPDGDLRLRRGLRAGQRPAHAVDDQPGAARPPHRLRPGLRPARAQDPGHRARHRRRLRQQGADLPRLRLRDRRLAGDRQAGQVDGGPHREPGVHRLRPRLRHARRDRGDQGRQDPRHPHPRARRPRRVQRHGSADQVPRRLLRRLHRQLRHRGGVLLDDGRLHQQGTRRRGLRLLVPDHRGRLPRRADGRLPRLRPGDGPGRAAAQEPHPARPVPVHEQDRLGLRLRRVRARPRPRARDGGVRRPAAPSRPRSAPAAS